MMNPQHRSSALPSASRRSALRLLALGGSAIVAAVSLSACGFKLRGSFTFAFTSLQVIGKIDSPVSKELQANLLRLGIRVGTEMAAAGEVGAVVLNVAIDQRERTVVGQTSSGQVRELVLRQRFRYTLSTASGKRLVEETELALERNITFNESDALAKAGEEQLMFNDMQSDAVQQVLRRLSAVKSL